MSQNEKILLRLKETPNEWVPMPELVKVSGSMNIHSRKSDLVKRGYNIENKVEQVGKEKHSYYRIIEEAA